MHVRKTLESFVRDRWSHGAKGYYVAQHGAEALQLSTIIAMVLVRYKADLHRKIANGKRVYDRMGIPAVIWVLWMEQPK